MYLMMISEENSMCSVERCCLPVGDLATRYITTLDESDTKNYQANVAQIWAAGETFDPKTDAPLQVPAGKGNYI